MSVNKMMTSLLAFVATALFLISCGQARVDLENNQQTRKNMVAISRETFGKINGQDIALFTLTNQNGMTVKLTPYGGIVTALLVPGPGGALIDVVLGFDSLQGYLDGHPYFGCIAGRYANRIAGGRFELDGKIYTLAQNNGPNHLHGGKEGLDKKIWRATEHLAENEAGVRLEYTSPEGEEGYPGNLRITVDYILTHDNQLRIDYLAESDAPTPVNLTHHGYFNLNGQGEGAILDHDLYLNADRYTEVDEALIPTGKLPSVSGTPMDFRTPHMIGESYNQVPGGYDHNFVLTRAGLEHISARLRSPKTGIVMEVRTTQPGVQFYAGTFLDGTLQGKNGKIYDKNAGLCLETQHFPDSPNQKSFPGTILRRGEQFRHTTIYAFSLQN
jgi:aldose 1-epimerase